jgi:threonine dehydratase
MELPVSFDDIESAARQIAPYAHETPLLEFAELNALAGGRVLLKAEHLQRTGSFKFRGACNMISRIDAAQAPGGVVAYSSGNHAQGVAEAARLFGFCAVLIMPEDAPEIKKRGVISRGGEIVSYDRSRESREEIAEKITRARGAVLAPPFEDERIIAGQGTAGLEMVWQAKATGARLDALYVPCSGGGLVSGCAIAVKHAHAQTQVFAVEPEGFEDMRRSLEAGERKRNATLSGSICDALLAPEPGELAFSISRHLLDGAISVSDDEVRYAAGFALRNLKQVVEPGGAAALALVLSGKVDLKGKVTGIVLSGGNADEAFLTEILALDQA